MAPMDLLLRAVFQLLFFQCTWKSIVTLREKSGSFWCLTRDHLGEPWFRERKVNY